MSRDSFLLKVSGDVVRNKDVVESIVTDIKDLGREGFKIALLVGGGSGLRGREMKLDNINNIEADIIGMMGTVVNALLLAAYLRSKDFSTEVFSSFNIDYIKRYNPMEVGIFFTRGGIPVLAGGTGNTGFTTDTASVLRAAELGIPNVLKGTNVDGVYTKDPKEEDAKFIDSISYIDAVKENIGVMDKVAYTLADVHDIHIRVFNILIKGNLKKAVKGTVGTLIRR